MGGAVACSVTGVRGDIPTNHNKHDKQTNPTNPHQPVKAGEKQERRPPKTMTSEGFEPPAF